MVVVRLQRYRHRALIEPSYRHTFDDPVVVRLQTCRHRDLIEPS